MENLSLSDIGSIASILSFIIALIIFFNVKKIKNFYIFKVRVPDLNKKFENVVSNISNFLNDYENTTNSIDEETAKCEVVLKSLKKKLPRSLKKSIKNVIERLNNYQNRPYQKTEGNLREIYVNALKILEEIKYIQEDIKWER